MEDKLILATGLNPAWQKTLYFKELRFYEVNRSEMVREMASGKGINFVRAFKNWGGKARVFQFTGGETGNKIKAYLDAEPLDHVSVDVESATRICTTCICMKNRKMTELIEPSGNISSEAAGELLELLKAEIPRSAALALCGTFPPGVSPDFYAEAAEKAVRDNIPVLIDAYKNVDKALDTVDILKINEEEIMRLSGQDDPLKAMEYMLKKPNIKILGVTAGAGCAYLGTGDGIFRYQLPRIEKLDNPIGAGDTVSAVFLKEYVDGTAPVEAFARGLSAASASCMTSEAAVFKPEEALKIKQNILIEEI